tara:strand:- start:511 stop:1143 length:633 start_codon:yes stop_codon:yes gene_type:complete
MINMINNMNPIQRYESRITALSPEAKTAIINIGLSWPDIVGASGSYISKTILHNIIKATSPWTVNKVTDNGAGRNGVTWSIIPTFTDLNLLNKIEGGRFTTYDLTSVGREIVIMMLLNCNRCSNTKVCQKCLGSPGYGSTDSVCDHVEVKDCEECHGTGDPDKDTGEHGCWNCEENCDSCDKNRKIFCWSCGGHVTCQYCKDLDAVWEFE